MVVPRRTPDHDARSTAGIPHPALELSVSVWRDSKDGSVNSVRLYVDLVVVVVGGQSSL